ncbi:hypothetical protein [Salinisphaera sp. Q1T1-3]|uniref:hypothetical protein n=1 Tax=Salinisphaera sp. Q1T1-3 TaxID=2321229 RepID=UPI000E738CD9|nr:hypothetical protein [Salinisphaera sp. Q1T1-3]RJS91190.1 hypothetical protein D3260_16155 [Salinisphaera sp. Q1T1-3]
MTAAIDSILPAGMSPRTRDGRGHRLILVREQDAQHSGSGCCGRLGERHTMLGRAADFSHSRAWMEHVGEIYRRLRIAHPALAIDIVDPRNTLWLYPAVWRCSAGAGQGLGWRLRQFVRAGSAAGAILDGEVLHVGQLPSARAVVDEIGLRLDLRDRDAIPGEHDR